MNVGGVGSVNIQGYVHLCCALSLSQTHTHTSSLNTEMEARTLLFCMLRMKNLIQCIYRKSSSVHTELESINLAK